jgi:DNA topoisomerase-3
VILEEGWRVLFPKKDSANSDDKEKEDEEQLMPLFVKGEKGEHIPDLQEKQTQPPKMHTEATLLRAMETAGKQVDDPELRDLMKENGIGRPSTRANIIETLFKRNYISRQRKNLVPTITGIQLIKTINNELLKSVELTGIWEKKLRQIEKGEYDPHLFLNEMKVMVSDLTKEVKYEHGQIITIEAERKKEASTATEADKTVSKNDNTVTEKKKEPKSEAPITCPKCNTGTIIKGKSAYGCSAFKDGCNFKIDFEFGGKKLSEKQLFTLIQKKKSPSIKGFLINNQKVNGHLIVKANFVTQFVEEQEKTKSESESESVSESEED